VGTPLPTPAPGGTTVPANNTFQAGSRLPESEGETIAVWQKTAGFEPVVGWIVCVQGPNQGKDYSLKSGINPIGRDPSKNVKVVISGDDLISREDHAEIEYDNDENTYYLIRKSNPEVRLNGKKVREPIRLQPYDTIRLGHSDFVFVPLCGDCFKWKVEL
jgi:hypothetical protein